MKKEAAILCVVYAFVMAWNRGEKMGSGGRMKKSGNGEVGMKRRRVDGSV